MNPNDPAFPLPYAFEDRGMNIRLYIATHALQGLLASGWDDLYENLAIEAFQAADALIEQEKNH